MPASPLAAGAGHDNAPGECRGHRCRTRVLLPRPASGRAPFRLRTVGGGCTAYRAGIAAGGWRPYTGRRMCAGAMSLGGAYAKPKTKSRKAVSRSLRLLMIIVYRVFLALLNQLSVFSCEKGKIGGVTAGAPPNVDVICAAKRDSLAANP